MVRLHLVSSDEATDTQSRALEMLERYLSSPAPELPVHRPLLGTAQSIIRLFDGVALPQALRQAMEALAANAIPRPDHGAHEHERALLEHSIFGGGLRAHDMNPGTDAAVRELLAEERAIQIAALESALREAIRLGRIGAVRQLSHAELLRLRRIARLLSYLTPVLQRRQPLNEVELCSLLSLAASCPADDIWGGWSAVVPLPPILRATARHIATNGPSPELEAALRALRATGEGRVMYAEQRKLLRLIDDMLRTDEVGARLLDPDDDWGHAARQALATLPSEERDAWLPLLTVAATAKGATPTGPWQKKAAAAVAAFGEERFKQRTIEWLALLRAPARDGERYAGRGIATHVPTAVFTERNGTLLRGLLWCCAGFDDADLARAVGDAAELCLKKIPNIGARSVKAGNAAIWALGRMPGSHGAGQLQRLAHRVKQPSARSLIESALIQAAARAGLTPADLEERAVPDFGLREGRLRTEVGGYTAEIAVSGAMHVEARWFKPDGTPLRAEPAAVKREAPEERAALRRTLDDIKQALPAQRDRIERLLLVERDWPLADWRERYLDQPLLSTLTRRLIWRFGEGDGALGVATDGAIADVNGRPLEGLTEETRVRLWHPIESSPESVVAWQRHLEERGVTQPFKQAHREVYLLTDAERATETYSNRFAAHILRQHQFKALCDARGWRYSLQGGFDGHNVPALSLPGAGLSVEFWVEGGDGPELMSEAGIYLYVATDQVRFLRATPGEWGRPAPLAEVPPRVFSEVLRDVDLFVGVCSVGNDPTWQDTGPREHRAYWQDYAFGDLSASAQTRRAVLERLLPRLAIAERCTLEEKFLVVRGELRTYRIHLGSGNILMEPNNQYLCIVPARGATAPEGGLFLPFEGDSMLSVILSKAFLLARDTAITDPTITRQIALS